MDEEEWMGKISNICDIDENLRFFYLMTFFYNRFMAEPSNNQSIIFRYFFGIII